MTQQYAVIVLFALIITSSLTSLDSYRTTNQMVCKDMDRALALALEEQQSDVICQDTIRTFNRHLHLPTGKVVLPTSRTTCAVLTPLLRMTWTTTA